MSSDRFKELKEVDEDSKSELEEKKSDSESKEDSGTTGSTEASGSTSTTDGTGSDSSTSTTESTETTGRTDTNSTTDTNGDTGSNGTTAGTGSSGTKSGSVKDRNPRMAMFPPEMHKNGYDDALRKIKALCSLADEEEPNKLSEFSGAVLKHGYRDFKGLCEELGLEDAYEEYGDVVEG